MKKEDIKIRILNYWEKLYFLKRITPILQELRKLELNEVEDVVTLMEFVSVVLESCVEFDNAQYEHVKYLGKDIKILSVESLDRIVQELQMPDIIDISRQALEENKIDFFTRIGGKGSNTSSGESSRSIDARYATEK